MSEHRMKLGAYTQSGNIGVLLKSFPGHTIPSH